MSITTVHYTVLHRSYKFPTRALTLILCFCCFKELFPWLQNWKYSIWGVTSYPELLRVLTSIPLPNFVLLTPI